MSLNIPLPIRVSPDGFDLTDDYPPLLQSHIIVLYGPGEFDRADAALTDQDTHTSRDLGISLGVATNTIGSGDEIKIRIAAGSERFAVKVGWRNVEWNGSEFSYSEDEVQLSSSFTNFDYDDTSGGTYTYKDNFVVWRDI